MSCPSPSSLLLLLIHPDHMECGLFIFVSAHVQKSVRAYLFALFFFLTLILRLFIYVYVRIYSYSQLHTPPIQPFQKEHKKKTCVAFSVWPRRAVVLLESVEGTATEALPKSIAWMQAWRLLKRQGLGSHIFHDFHLKLQNCWMLNFEPFCDFELALDAIDPDLLYDLNIFIDIRILYTLHVCISKLVRAFYGSTPQGKGPCPPPLGWWVVVLLPLQ